VIVNGIQRARPGQPVEAQLGRIGPDGQVLTEGGQPGQPGAPKGSPEPAAK